MTKFERKYGKYAIKDLSLMLILCYVVGYLIQLISPEFFVYLTLNPYRILHGELWRLVTWIVIPPRELSILTFIMLFFYYSVGKTLEKTWGDYRYNLYIFSGMLFTIVGSFVAFFLASNLYREELALYEALRSGMTESIYTSGSTLFSTYYINMSILLAFAMTFPDVEVLLMFVIPIKMKWLGIIYAGMLAIDVYNGVGSGNFPVIVDCLNLFYRISIVSSLLNFIVFFITSRKHFRKNNLYYFKRRF